MKVGDTVYIVRYALTRGVIKLKIQKTNLGSLSEDHCWFGGWIFGPDKSVDRRYYTSEADALRCAEEMRSAKIERLMSQIARITKKKIKVIEP